MKRFPVVLAALVVAGVALGDGNVYTNIPGSTPVAVTSQQAATLCVESDAAAAAATSTTVPALAGQFFYITNITSMVNAIAAPAATLYPTTSTNVPGAYAVRQAVQAAVGNFVFTETFAVPLKTSVVGTATVFSGTALANVSASFRVCGFYAP